MKAIAAGAAHSLALRVDGTVWACGAGDHGQLGWGFPLDHATITEVKGVASGGWKKAIAAGDSHSLALRADGSAWSWGANDKGQLGDDTNDDRLVPVMVRDGSQGANQWLEKVTAIAAGGQHSLALNTGSAGIKSGGLVCAWGANGEGQLGDKTNDDRRMAVHVWPKKGPALRAVVWIAGGGAHSLAVAQSEPPW
jgi:alpha-tubulin suppressor-like RCC1 family protein